MISSDKIIYIIRQRERLNVGVLSKRQFELKTINLF